jgi:PhoPQ-activated pathogenicity-related protein
MYVESKIACKLLNIFSTVDYLDRYENTKLMLINSAGDEFFLPDDSDYFWPDLRSATNGSAMVRRLPNAEHSCAGHEISIFFTLRSFFLSAYSVFNILLALENVNLYIYIFFLSEYTFTKCKLGQAE